MTHFGFIEEDVKITEEDYKFGYSLERKTLVPDGNWEPFLPKYEGQATIYETWACTVYAGQNQIETYLKKVFGTDENYSERYNYILANIKEPGASPTDAYETFRKKGLINDTELPYSNTYEEFVTPKPMDIKHLEEGKKWLQTYDYKHEWVRSNDMHAIIKHALRYSTIAVSVSAWFLKDGLYVDMGVPNNHFVLCYGFDGDVPLIFDSYDQSKKRLSPNHTIKFAKRILLKKRVKSFSVIKTRWWESFNLFRIWKINYER